MPAKPEQAGEPKPGAGLRGANHCHGHVVKVHGKLSGLSLMQRKDARPRIAYVSLAWQQDRAAVTKREGTVITRRCS
jgi:hypothetical protein